jgi:zinc transport system substrate-binding protein
MDLNGSEAHPEEEHDHGGSDPHFWLDPLAAKVQVDNILEGFSKADPGNKGYYVSNAGSLKDRLDDLDHEFASGLENRTKDDIITTHEGFNHLAGRYGFHAHAAVGISGDEQPSVQDLSDLVKEIDDLGLGYVFVEPTFSDQYMEAISDETGATLLVLDGLHGRTGVHSGMDYFQIMRENLRNLRIGLEAEGGGPR